MYNYGFIYNNLAPLALNNTPQLSMDYWTRSLYQRITALIDFKGLPEGSEKQYAWDVDALKYGLFYIGFLAVFESKAYGVVPQPGALTGFGLQFQPSGVIINTPYFQISDPLKIGVQCELLKLTPDYTGVMDIVTKYAAELKEIDTSIKSAARNTRFGYALIADSDKSARTLKAVREKIINGDDAIIDEKLLRRKGADPSELPWYEFDRDLRSNYILGDLLEARRTTLVDFYREIGVRMVDEKKERMITGEVAAGEAETFIRSEVWAEALTESCKKINAMFGTSIQATINRPDYLGGQTEGEEATADVR